MQTSTKKRSSWGTIVLIAVLIAGLVIGGYFLYSYWKALQTSPLEISLDPSFHSEKESSSSFFEDIPEVGKTIDIQQVLQTENEELIAKLEGMETYQEQFDQLKVGREVMNDFAGRFLKYETLLNSNSFIQFFSELAQNYIENKAIPVKGIKTSHPLSERFHDEFMTWVINQEDEKFIALANFVSFYLVEPLYQLPLRRVASGLSSEIEAIDFQMLLQVANVERPPVRDKNGELKMGKRVYLHDYTSAQQFLYRRGPRFSAKMLVFLKTYLAYADN